MRGRRKIRLVPGAIPAGQFVHQNKPTEHRLRGVRLVQRTEKASLVAIGDK